MPTYWLSLYRTADQPASRILDDAMMADIDALNDEMVTAGVRVFVGGLQSPDLARTLRRAPDGSIEISNGPLLGQDVYVDGFWVLSVADEEAALAWARKAAAACRASVDLRPFN
jgi:hypothetical protein